MPGISFEKCRSLLSLQDMKRKNRRARNTDTAFVANTGAPAKGKGKNKKKGHAKDAAPAPVPPAPAAEPTAAPPSWPSPQYPWNGAIQMWPYGGQGGLLGRHQPAYTAPPSYMPRHAPSPQTFYAQNPYDIAPAPYAINYGYTPAQPAYGLGAPASPAPSSALWDQAALMNQFQTMGLQAPTREWVMDTGASSHFASDPGMLISVSPPSLSRRAVVVGNGSTLSITGTGHARFPISTSSRPLYLRNVLVAPDIVKNLLSVRQFTIDNRVSVEFDPLGFSVKDLQTRTEILRCNSFGALYSIRPSSTSRPHAFLVVDSALWHRRLGHPGRPVMEYLARSSIISREKNKSSLCQGLSIRSSCSSSFFFYPLCNHYSVSNNSL